MRSHLLSGTLTRNQKPQGLVGQDEIPVPKDGNVTITPVLEGDVARVTAVTTSVAVKIDAITWSQNLFAVEVDTRDAFYTGTTLENVVGTVQFHLVVVARDVFARDALETNWDLHEEDDVTVTSTGMPSIWSLPLPMWLPQLLDSKRLEIGPFKG